MAVDVVVPQMGESVLEGTILEWKVKVGDKIKINQPLVELMTDKVNVEIPAEVDGILAGIFVKEGDVVPVGARIASIDDGSPDKPAAAPKKAETKAPAPQTTAKAPEAAPAPVKAVAKATATIGKGKMSPKVKMLIRQYSIDPSTITPTGKNGLVTVDDVMLTVESRTVGAGFSTGPVPSPSLPSLPTITKNLDTAISEAAKKAPNFKVEIPVFEALPQNIRERHLPLEGIRKIISDHMVHSVQKATHVTTFEDIDLTELTNYRNSIKEQFKADYGVNITYMPYIAKAVCAALKEYPKINASMTEKEIIYKNYYNIGIAVAREEGLIVPVIKDADKKTIVELAVEIASLGEKSRTNRLLPDDVSGGTFSLTNAGMFGAGASTPIINQPQSAILGIHAISKRPWVINDEIVIRHISTFALSFDHRLIDGHEAVQFLHRVHEFLSDLKKLMLYLR